ADQAVLRRDLAGQLSFVTLLVDRLREWDARHDGLGADRRLLVAARAEEPETIANDASAQRSFVHAVDVVEVIGFAGEVGLGLPLIVAEAVAERAVEFV